MVEQTQGTNYSEIAEQIYNLVDNDQDKINAFLSAKASPEEEERKEIERWFDNYVKPDELNDLMKKGQNKRGLVKWLADDSNNEYLKQHLNVFDISTASQDTFVADTSSIAREIEDEDDEIYNGYDTNDTDVSISSNKVDDPDEIGAALKALEDDPDIDITFELVNLDDSSDDDSSDEESVKTTKKQDKAKKISRKKVHLNHSINRLVKKIDDEEIEDRAHHEKYYVAKRDQLGKARYAKNKANKSALKTSIKKFNTAVAEGNKDAVQFQMQRHCKIHEELARKVKWQYIRHLT